MEAAPHARTPAAARTEAAAPSSEPSHGPLHLGAVLHPADVTLGLGAAVHGDVTHLKLLLLDCWKKILDTRIVGKIFDTRKIFNDSKV